MRFLQCLLLFVCLAFSLASVQAQEPIKISQIGRGTVESVQWHPDNNYIMVTTVTGVWLYTPNLKDLAHIPAYFAQMSPDGRYIAGLDENRFVSLWDAETFEKIDGHGVEYFRSLSALIWSPDSQTLVVTGNTLNDSIGLALTIPALESTMATRVIAGAEDLQWSPQGHYLAARGSGGIYVLDMHESGRPLTFYDFRVSGAKTGMLWRDEAHLLLLNFDEYTEASLWNVETLEESSGQHFSHPMPAYNHSASLLASASFARVYLHDPATNQILAQLLAGDFWVGDLSWSHAENILAVGVQYVSESPINFVVIDSQKQSIEHEVKGPLHNVKQLAWSHDDRFLLAIDAFQQFAVFETETWTTVSFSSLHAVAGDMLAWSPDSHTIALADPLTNIGLWNVVAAQRVHLFSGSRFPIVDIQWRTDLLLSVISSDIDSIDLAGMSEKWLGMRMSLDWGLTEPIAIFAPEHSSWRNILNNRLLSNNIYQNLERYIFSVSAWEDNETQLVLQWGAHSDPTAIYVNPVLYRFEAPFTTYPDGVRLVGSLNEIRQGFISPDGHYVAVVSSDNNGMIWDTSTTKPTAMIAATSNVVWSPDETRAMIQRTDGTLWLLTGEGLILAQIPTLVSTQRPSGTFFWSPDSRQVAYLHGGVAEVWQVRP